MQDIRKGALLIWSFLLCAGSVYAAPTAAPLDLTLIQTIADPEGDARLDYAAVDPVTRRLYVARGDGVMAVDLNSGKVTHQVVAGKRVHAVVPLAGNRVLSTNGDSHSVTLFDGLSGQIIAETVTGQKPDGAFFEPFSGSVFVMDGKDGIITLVDPVRGSAIGQIRVGGKLETAVTDGQGRVFVNVEDRAEMAVIDVASRQVVTRYPLPGCDSPSGLALDSKFGLLVGQPVLSGRDNKPPRCIFLFSV
jgi:DNA-binding beta-propeller fold protein YncE